MAESNTSLQDLPPHLLYKILTQGSLSAVDLAHLEATCYAFRAAHGLLPLRFKSVVDIAAFDLCMAHPLYSSIPPLYRMQLLRRCGSNWKMLLRFLQSTEQANGQVSTSKGKVQVAAGRYHSLLVHGGSKGVFTYGRGLPCIGSDMANLRLFTPVVMPQVGVAHIASSYQHAAFITSSGELYTYGANAYGCCGLEDANGTVAEPTIVLTLKGMHCKQVYTWGKGHGFALGQGNEVDVMISHGVPGLSEVRAAQVCARKRGTFVLSDDGRLFAFGWMGFGSLGVSNRQNWENVRTPSVLESLKCHRISQVCSGLYHTLVVTDKGAILGFGDNDAGQLGTRPSGSSCAEPIEMTL